MNGFVKFMLILVILSTLCNLVGQVILWAPPVDDSDIAQGGGSGSNDNNPGNNGNENKPGSGTSVTVGSSNAPYLGDVYVSTSVETDAEGKVTEGGVTLDSSLASATVPEGVQMEEGATELTLTINNKEDSEADLDLNENEVATSLDVHMAGVSADNTIPMEIKLFAAMAKGLNSTSVKLYHVENGETVEMTRVANNEEFTAHNQFKYDPATGDVTLYIAGFSEFVLLKNDENKWEGVLDYSWYDESKTELTIANADQLAALSAIVGGMKKVTGRVDNKYIYSDEVIQDSFAGKTIKLLADINLGDDEENNNSNIIFYPIGYWNNEGTYERKPSEERKEAVSSGFYTFEGTFDGNGHTIENFYQNTWEMKGDHDWYNTTTEQYFRDGMGLFGRLYKATVKNLTIKNFSSDGEITTTGTIAAYAEGTTFENIAIFNCNPRVYNIGNGGIVGCVGWYAKEADLKTTFKNITVDNTNKISALWGSYDVACGGIVGQYYPTSGQTSANKPANGGMHFENCHVSAIMDVYNDVCANYQYYAYRYTGILIGSVRENVTIDGHSYPKMDGITASGCTVHYGDWNDYYYCELVANSLASYTHDHQMSRLTQVASVDVDNMKVTDLKGNTTDIPTSGRVNYVVVKAKDANGKWIHGDGHDYAECYHFVNGVQHFHDVADADNPNPTETVNGVEGVLKEDKQLIYREFNNLVTGYGWGVTSKGVGDLAGVVILDTVYENADGSSIDKFVGTTDENALKPLTGSTINIGTLFSAKEGIEVALNPATIIVSVTPLGENSTVRGTYSINESEWTNGTLDLTGVGQARVTITDYLFCNPTSVIIDVQPVNKFDTKFTNYKTYLYRVGNQNAIALGTIFKHIENARGIDSESVKVTVTDLNGQPITVVLEEKADWVNTTIKFTGISGVVKVTIKDNESTEFTLPLEIIDAKNITSAEGTTTGGNFVLVSDINTSSYVNYWNCSVYGNGFTYSLKGAPTAYNSKQGKGILITKNAVLDNLVIEGDIYNAYGAFTNQDYYNTAIDVQADTTIQNCYISGCSAPVRARNNVTIINSTLYGGAVANLIIEDGTATLTNVTTANFDDGRTVVGMGIVVHSDATESAKLVLSGTLTQYNFISDSNKPSDTYAQNLYSAMFGSSCSQYHFGSSPNKYVNTGIVSMTDVFNNEDITDNANTGYKGQSITLSGKNGYVYTQPNTSGSVNNNCPEYIPTTQGAVAPTYSFDYTNKNYVAKEDGSNDYCYAENGKVNISMDQGDTFSWDTSILTIGKGITNYTVTMNGTDYTGKSIAFNTAGEYTVIYTYTDDNNYKLDENGNITTYSATYTKTVNITVAVVKAATKHAEFTFGSSNTASTTVTIGNSTYVMPNVSGTSSTFGSTTVNGQTIYYPIVEIIMSDGKTSHSSGWYAYFPVFSGAVTITDYADNGNGDKLTPYNGSTTTMPSGLSVVGDAKTLFKYQSGSNAGESPVVKNNKLVYSSAKIEANREEYNTVVQYSYTDNAGATYYYYIGYHAPKQTYSPGCFTPETLITLADGSQKRVDELKANDQILAWDFFTGSYVAKDISLLVNHGEDLYRVANLGFSDGTELRVIAEHGIFDYDLNKFVYLSVDNMSEYIGHRFVKYAADGSYDIVTLISAYETEEYTSAWSVSSAITSNAFASGLLTVAPPEDFYNWIEMDGKLHYDVEQFQKDVETYGLYTYEDFADYVTYEQFVEWNGAYLKIAVEKGYFTFDYILELIEMYKGWMP